MEQQNLKNMACVPGEGEVLAQRPTQAPATHLPKPAAAHARNCDREPQARLIPPAQIMATQTPIPDMPAQPSIPDYMSFILTSMKSCIKGWCRQKACYQPPFQASRSPEVSSPHSSGTSYGSFGSFPKSGALNLDPKRQDISYKGLSPHFV